PGAFSLREGVAQGVHQAAVNLDLPRHPFQGGAGHADLYAALERACLSNQSVVLGIQVPLRESHGQARALVDLALTVNRHYVAFLARPTWRLMRAFTLRSSRCSA